MVNGSQEFTARTVRASGNQMPCSGQSPNLTVPPDPIITQERKCRKCGEGVVQLIKKSYGCYSATIQDAMWKSLS